MVTLAGMEVWNGLSAAKKHFFLRGRPWTKHSQAPAPVSSVATREAERTAQQQRDKVIAEHKELLKELLRRQSLEAEAMRMAHTMELTHGMAPAVTVHFAFPDLFKCPDHSSFEVDRNR
ncbi:unnamed protein product [Choristocarpus tenellus]